jgi:hypothetical protein
MRPKVQLMRESRLLFGGMLGTQRVHVWLERHGSGIALYSHDIGPLRSASTK